MVTLHDTLGSARDEGAQERLAGWPGAEARRAVQVARPACVYQICAPRARQQLGTVERRVRVVAACDDHGRKWERLERNRREWEQGYGCVSLFYIRWCNEEGGRHSHTRATCCPVSDGDAPETVRNEDRRRS